MRRQISKIFRRLSFFCLLLLIAPGIGPLFAKQLDLRSIYNQTDLAPYMEFLRDPGEVLSFQDIVERPEQGWTMGDPGVQLDAAVLWIRLDLKNSQFRTRLWYFLEQAPNLSQLTLFTPRKDGGYRVVRNGNQVPFIERKTGRRQLAFAVRIPAGSQGIYYLRYKSGVSFRPFLSIEEEYHHIHIRDIEEPLHWIYYGVLFALFLYNFFLAAYLKEAFHLFFCLHIFSFIFLIFAINGHGDILLWPNYPIIKMRMLIVTCLLIGVGMNEFSRGFLKLDIDMPLLAKLLRYVTFYFLALLGLNFLVEPQNLLPFLFIGVSIYLSFLFTVLFFSPELKRNEMRIQFAMTTGIFMVFVLIAIIYNLGVTPPNLVAEYGYQVMSGYMFFSLTLRVASRINEMKIISEEADQKFEYLSEQSDYMLFILGMELTFITANRAFYRHLGLNFEEIHNKSLFDVLLSGKRESRDPKNVLIKEIQDELRHSGNSVIFRELFHRKKSKLPLNLEIKLELLGKDTEPEILGSIKLLTDDIILRHLRTEKNTLLVTNQFSTVGTIVNNLTRHLPAPFTLEIQIALREMILNAIEHGNLAINFNEKSKALSGNQYFELLQARRADSRYTERRVRIESRNSKYGVVFRIIDEGAGFDHQKISKDAPRLARENLLPHGRGIQMTGDIFERVIYNKKGNQVILVKRFRKELKPG